MKPEIFDPRTCHTGEGPISLGLDNEEVMWVDIIGKRVLSRNLRTDKTSEYETVEDVGFVIPRTSGGYILGTATGPIAIDASCEREEFPTRRDADKKSDPIPTRWNDAKVAPDGALFLNTLTYALEPGAGGLYRVHPDDLKLERILSDFTIPNGMGWNQAGDTFYLIDTPTGAVEAFDYRDGEIGKRRTMWRTDDKSQGLPDGMCIDAEDGIWVAFWSGGCMRRIDPHSGYRVTEEIRFPVPHVTSCAFAGDKLQFLIATTGHQGDTENKQAGMTFILEPGVLGTPTRKFNF